MTYRDTRVEIPKRRRQLFSVKSLLESIYVDDLGQHLTSNPCHLSCWINLIYHLNDLPAQFGRVTSNINHFSFQKIRMIGMPFQTWLLDLKFENDSVTCFGNRIVMNCFSFQPGSGQYMPNTPVTCHHKFQSDRCIWEPMLHCIAFRLSLMSLAYGGVLILAFEFLHSNSPHDPILTKHQAFTPSGPMLFSNKSSTIRVEFSLRPSARAWQQTHDLRKTMKPKANIYTAKLRKVSP